MLFPNLRAEYSMMFPAEQLFFLFIALHLMQNVSDETFDAVAVRKSLSKLSDFQSDTASPYRALHQAQGDKQEINPIRL